MGLCPTQQVSLYQSDTGQLFKLAKVNIFSFGDTLEFQIDNTVGKNLHGWKKDIDNGARATEMCPDTKAIGIWLFAKENL